MIDKDRLRGALSRLAVPGALAQSLSIADASFPCKRIYVMGCGRSGTWLLTSMFSSFSNVALVSKELPVEYFGVLKAHADAAALVIKRNNRSYERVEDIPAQIGIIWIVRHPFDVLTSHNPMSGRNYHIEPWRFLGEMLALQYLIGSKRPGLQVVKYEDLVRDPASVQQKIATHFGLSVEFPPNEIASRFRPPAEAERAMHGVRDIDLASVSRYKHDPKHIEHLRRIFPRIRPVLDWLEQEFGYDLILE